MAALVLTSQPTPETRVAERTQAASWKLAAAVKAGLLPSPQLLKLSPPPLVLPPPPSASSSMHGPAKVGLPLPQAPPQRCWMVSELSGYGPKTPASLSGRRLL